MPSSNFINCRLSNFIYLLNGKFPVRINFTKNFIRMNLILRNCTPF